MQALEAVCGGAPHAKIWTEAWRPLSNEADLAEYFDETLGKVDVNQIVATYSDTVAAFEKYSISREDCPEKKALVDRTVKAIFQTRLTQLHCVLFKTAKKSKHPVDRLRAALSQFETEDFVDGRHAAYHSIGEPVRAWLQTKFGLLKEDPCSAVAAAIAGA